jgi:hypothetical protein
MILLKILINLVKLSRYQGGTKNMQIQLYLNKELPSDLSISWNIYF